MISVDVNVIDCVEYPRPHDQHRHSIVMTFDMEVPGIVCLLCEREGEQVFEANIDLDALETVVLAARAAEKRHLLSREW